MTRASAEGWTPGPWATKLHDTSISVLAGKMYVLNTSWHSSIRERYPLKAESIANAKLAAAAPDLYDALQAFSTAYECEDDSYADKLNAANDLMVAALSKARGEA